MWRVVRCGLNPQDKLVLQGVRYLVSSKQDLRVFEQLSAKQNTEHMHGKMLKCVGIGRRTCLETGKYWVRSFILLA